MGQKMSQKTTENVVCCILFTFDTVINMFLKQYLKKVSRRQHKHEHLPSMHRAIELACKHNRLRSVGLKSSLFSMFSKVVDIKNDDCLLMVYIMTY